MGRARLVERTTLYRGRIFRLVREVWEAKGSRAVRETVRHPGAVVIVPMPDPSHIVFVRQYRHAVRRTLLELPAGTLEGRERPRACARRELEEETGWRASRMRQIGRFYAAPGYTSERLTVFLAQGLRRVPRRPEPDESVRPAVLSLRTALAKIRSGAICDAKTIIGVLFTQRLLQRRRERIDPID